MMSIAEKIYKGILKKKAPELNSPLRSLSNVKYDEKEGYFDSSIKFTVLNDIKNKRQIYLHANIIIPARARTDQAFSNYPIIIVITSIIIIAITIPAYSYFKERHQSDNSNSRLSSSSENVEPIKIEYTQGETSLKMEVSEGMKHQIQPVNKLTHFDRDTGVYIEVGEWSGEDIGDERIIRFIPMFPIKQDDSGIFFWLAKEIVKYGTGKFSDEGEVIVHVSKDVRLDRLIGQVSWVFYTKLKENGLID